MRIFFGAYLHLFQALIFSPVLAWCGVPRRRLDAFRRPAWKKNPPLPEGMRTTWFHAASVGELEILFPLIEEFLQKGIPTAVSIFSESAWGALERLPAGLIYAGFSPPEKDWRPLFQRYQVNRVMVSKYEAWPGLWMACGDLGLPLLLINAQWRKSLRWIRRILPWFGAGAGPRLFFFALHARENEILKEHFPDAQTFSFSDPRWIRILQRSQKAPQNPRICHWRLQAEQEKYPRPFLMVGSAWFEDLQVLVPEFKKMPGTLWVVPHSLHSENVKKMENFLESHLWGRYVLVKEMGILLELYSLADVAWVGGGFGGGVHSTMEPAVFSLPIACGPYRVEEFFETEGLQKRGQLTVIHPPKMLSTWLQSSPQFLPFQIAQKTDDFDRLVEQCLRIH